MEDQLLFQGKANLYSLLISKDPTSLTENEAELMFILSKDPDIQKLFDERKLKTICG